MKQIDTDVLIIGAGPIGLFSVFQLGQLGMKSCVVDCLPKAGGQCSELYPEKPIYDIPAYPIVTGKELVDNLENQIKPFNSEFLLNQRVDQVISKENKFIAKTSLGNEISSKCIFIAAGNGAFGPNKPPLENIKSFEDISVLYSIDKKEIFLNKTIAIAGGGDSAVDWAIELSNIAEKIYFIHRRQKLRAAPNNVEKLKKLSLNNNVELVIPFQIDSIQGVNGKIETLTVKDLKNKKDNFKLSIFFLFLVYQRH